MSSGATDGGTRYILRYTIQSGNYATTTVVVDVTMHESEEESRAQALRTLSCANEAARTIGSKIIWKQLLHVAKVEDLTIPDELK